MALDTTTGAAILKKLYPDGVMKNLTFQDRPFLAMVPKAQWAGSTVEIPLIYGNPAGVSSTMSTAITNKGNSASKCFAVTMRKIYGVGAIDNEIMEKSATDKGAFVQALKYEADNVLGAVSNRLASQLFRTGGGSIGKVSAVTSTTLTLTNASDAVNFEVGMLVGGDTVDGGGTVHSGAEPITAVNRDTGVLTAAAWTDITGVAAGDFLFQEGCYDTSLHGLGSWVPTTAPGATDFFGVNRSADVSRLGGLRVAATEVSGYPIEQKLLAGLTRCAVAGGKPDVIFMNPVDFGALVDELGSKVQYNSFKVGEIGFSALRIYGQTGEVKVMADRFCPENLAYAIQLNTMRLFTTSGGAPKFLDLDGKLSRESTSDAYEFRVGLYGNMTCSAPGFNCVIDLT